jgi:hypothetical protein
VKNQPKTVQALTLRVPAADYNLLRAEAFVRDRSINEVVLSAIRTLIESDLRELLEQVLAQARAVGSVRGRGAQPPFKLPRKVGEVHKSLETDWGHTGSMWSQTGRFQRSKISKLRFPG